MAIYQLIPRPIAQLFRLTLQLKGSLWNVYSMGENVDDAFNNYMNGLRSRKESTNGLEFVDGELANPHARLPL